jgi:hypothetical protein
LKKEKKNKKRRKKKKICWWRARGPCRAARGWFLGMVDLNHGVFVLRNRVMTVQSAPPRYPKARLEREREWKIETKLPSMTIDHPRP